MPRRRAQSGEPVCAEAKGKPLGAQLLSEAERRRGCHAHDHSVVAWGKDMLSDASECAPTPVGQARTGWGEPKADAGRSKTVAECQAAPKLPVTKWGEKPRRPSRQARETRSSRTK